MSDCRFCSAPVDRRKGFCGYCRSRLELDLHGGLDYRLYEPDSKRNCPNCDCTLATIDLQIDQKFLIEKCDQCFGLFFDQGELEMLLNRSVTNIFKIDTEELFRLQTESRQTRAKDFKYIKCPVCQVLMNRLAFGYLSGVIINQCRKHGIWLHEGELRQLQEWKKAGGELRQKAANKGYGHRKFSHTKTDNTYSPPPKTRRTYGREKDTDNLNILDLFTSIF